MDRLRVTLTPLKRAKTLARDPLSSNVWCRWVFLRVGNRTQLLFRVEKEFLGSQCIVSPQFSGGKWVNWRVHTARDPLSSNVWYSWVLLRVGNRTQLLFRVQKEFLGSQCIVSHQFRTENGTNTHTQILTSNTNKH